jgi:hypothetical protein
LERPRLGRLALFGFDLGLRFRLGLAGRRLAGQALGAHGAFDGVGDAGVLLQETPRRVAALAQAFLVVQVPGAGLLHDSRVDAHVEQAVLAGDAFAEDHVELGLLEGRGDLVLHDLDAHAVADHLVPLLDALHPADVEAHGGIEFQGHAARGRLGVAVHDADLHAQLVDEDDERFGTRDVGGEFP